MLFVDYYFDLMPDGSILMDKELSAKSLQVKSGDKFVVDVSFDGRIFFRKLSNVDTKTETNRTESNSI